MTITCPNCNATLEGTVKFCSQCGTPVANSSPPASSVSERSKRMGSIIKELTDNSPGDKQPGEIFDFEKYRGEIVRRALKYAEAATVPFTDEAWMAGVYSYDRLNLYLHMLATYFQELENPFCLPTNKPNAHFVLFMRIAL